MPWGDSDKVVSAAPTWGADDKVVQPVSAAYAQGRKTAKSGVLGGLTGSLATLEEVVPFADEAQAGISALGRMAQGEKPGAAWKNSREYQQGLMTGFREAHPVLSNLSRGGGLAVDALPILLSGGAAAPEVADSVAPGLAAKAGGLLMTGARNATTGATLASGAALAGRGDLPTRLRDANRAAGPGAVAGVVAPAAASIVAKGAGAIGGGISRLAGKAAPTEPSTAGLMTAQNPAAMEDQVAAYRAVGIQPALADIVDDSGRGVVRAAANRMTPGRQVANDFADARALDLPSRISGQARRVMSADARTPDEIRTAMAAERTTHANAAFGAVRGDTIPLAPETVSALRTDYGRAAIAEAASRETDPEIRAALNRLHGDAMDNPGGTEVTIGMADRVSRVLLGKAQAAARSGDNELAAQLGNLGRSIRRPAAKASPGYATALEGYAADSKLHDAAGIGEGLMTRNTDEFVAGAKGLSDPERELALAAGRRAIERRSGENIGSAPGVARALAEAPEQQARNAALMGPERAQDLQQGMRLEARRLDNARMVQPKAGSATHLNDADSAALAQKAGAITRGVRQAASHDWVGLGMDWLRSRGMSDADAEALVRMATDPNQTDRAIQLIAARRLGQQDAQAFIRLRNGIAAPAGIALQGNSSK